MIWYSRDGAETAYAPMTESKTLAVCERIVGVAIGRWILSGAEFPDMDATDGVSEFEAANYL